MISITVITVVRESNWTGGSLLHSLVSHSLCGWTGENSMVTKGGIPTKKNVISAGEKWGCRRSRQHSKLRRKKKKTKNKRPAIHSSLPTIKQKQGNVRRE